jgi:hypothetical protein
MSALHDLQALFERRALRLLALTALIVAVGAECLVKRLYVLDPDVWWHVCVGSWIVQHRAFPETGIFSRTAASHPWRAYSWGYEVLISRSYEWFSFIGMGIFGTALTVGAAVAVFFLLYRISRRFWVAWLLAAVVYAAFLFYIAPRPVFITAILFSITLTLLLEAQRSGNVRFLYSLPLVFLLWANCHIQFFYGIATVGLFAAINLFQRILISLARYPDSFARSMLPVGKVLVVFGFCVVATCLGPYSFHLYEVVFGYATSKIIYRMINEFQPPSFKFFNQYIELMLAAAGFYAIGFAKKIDPFKLALLILGSIFAVRTVRDAWFVCIPAAAIIADLFAREKENPATELRSKELGMKDWAGVAFASILLLLLVGRNVGFDTRSLDRAISKDYPVDAVNFLRRNPVGGPLYNSFNWGGFLIFYMPQYPVSIDGRTDLYGDAINEQYWDTQEAKDSYSTDPYLAEAGVVLLPTKLAISTALTGDRRFRVIYRDDIAVIFVRNY